MQGDVCEWLYVHFSSKSLSSPTVFDITSLNLLTGIEIELLQKHIQTNIVDIYV